MANFAQYGSQREKAGPPLGARFTNSSGYPNEKALMEEEERRLRRRSGESVEPEGMLDLFHKFCSSSTIHGTYFLTETTTSRIARLGWAVVVFLGIIAATFIINRSFEGWKKNPIITSVAQKPIESIYFLAITICPLDDTRFGYVESKVNEKSANGEAFFDVEEISHQLLDLIHTKRPLPLEGDCLIDVCLAELELKNSSSRARSRAKNRAASSSDDACSTCVEGEDFLTFYRDVSKPYEENPSVQKGTVLERLTDSIHRKQYEAFHTRAKRQAAPAGGCNTEAAQAECFSVVKDFRFLDDLQQLMPEAELNEIFRSARPGTLLQMLNAMQYDDPQAQYETYERFIDRTQFPELYRCYKEGEPSIPVPDLVTMLAPFGWKEKELVRERVRNARAKAPRCTQADVDIEFGSDLIQIMRDSVHPPHVISKEGKPVPQSAFPTCVYDGGAEGITVPRYDSPFCNKFQTTFNEIGMCYTYNNYELDLEGGQGEATIEVADQTVKVRSVQGCGKEKGLQLIVDNNRVPSLAPAEKANRGFKVFITAAGGVTSKVPFVVDAGFHGEHTFFLHGIHSITASPDFTEWNEDHNACYFEDGYNLTYFRAYAQDSCLLEYKLRKLGRRCGCYPFFVNQTELEICGYEGNQCFSEELSRYRDDLIDRTESGCLNDCTMTHFFATMIRESYEIKMSDPGNWYNPEEGTGQLKDYLLDPENVFSDRLTKGMMMLFHNKTDYSQIAKKRFEENIGVLNFYFDTPIITQIQLELRTSIFDMISAIGGSLGLFTGVSIITFVEIAYWISRFFIAVLLKGSAGVGGRTKVQRVESPLGQEFNRAGVYDRGGKNAFY